MIPIPFARLARSIALLLCLALPLRAELPSAAQEALNQGVIAAKLPDYLLAIRYFEEARQLAPNEPAIYYNLGLAESKIPGRELRAMAWFGAYLASRPDAANASAVRGQIAKLDAKNQSDLSRLLLVAENAAKLLGPPATFDRERAHINVAVLWAKSGHLEAAFRVTDGLQVRQFDALTEIAKFQAETGDIAGAQMTAGKIQAQLYKDDALRSIAGAQAKAGDKVGALETARCIEDSRYRSGALALAGDIAGALQTAEGFQKDREYDKGKVLEFIARIQVKAGDFTGALKTVGTIHDVNIFNAARLTIASEITKIAESQAKAGDFAGALKTAADIQDESYKLSALVTIAREQTMSGDFTSARRTAGNIQTDDGKCFIAEAQVEAGDIAGAKITSDRIQDFNYMARAQFAIAEAQAKAGDIIGAKSTANDMKPHPLYKCLTQAAIATAQIGTGDIKGAKQTLRAAQKIADGIPEKAKYDYGRSEALATVAEVETRIKSGKGDTKNATTRTPAPTKNPWVAKHDELLNGPIFLDISSHLKSLPPDEANAYFRELHSTIEKIVDARMVFTDMLKQLAQHPAEL